jgi:hypothetical protein
MKELAFIMEIMGDEMCQQAPDGFFVQVGGLAAFGAELTGGRGATVGTDEIGVTGRVGHWVIGGKIVFAA